MATKPDAAALIRFATSLRGRHIKTIGGRASFRVATNPRGLEYYPLSSGKRRFQETAVVKRILKRYDETRSMSPGSYRDITWNASYALALLKLYLSHAR